MNANVAEYAPVVSAVGGWPAYALAMLVLLVIVASGLVTFLAVWRGVPKLGIPGLGAEMRDDLREIKTAVVGLSTGLKEQLDHAAKNALEIALLKAQNQALEDRLRRLEEYEAPRSRRVVSELQPIAPPTPPRSRESTLPGEPQKAVV